MKIVRYIVLAFLTLGLIACGAPHQFTGSVLDPPKPADDFTLTDQNGQPFQLSAQGGKVTLIYFGYTNCPDFCPTTLGDWKLVKQQLGSDAANVNFVMISVDPERDTEPVLQQYMAQFDPTFIGLRPTMDQVETLSKQYGVGVDSAAAGHDHGEHNPAMHGTYSYAIDGQGQVRLLFPYDTDPAKVADDVRALLAS